MFRTLDLWIKSSVYEFNNDTSIKFSKEKIRIKYTVHESHINTCMKVKEDLMIRIGKRIKRTRKWERESRKGKGTSFRSSHVHALLRVLIAICMFLSRAASTQGARKALQSFPVEAGLPYLELSKYLN